MQELPGAGSWSRALRQHHGSNAAPTLPPAWQAEETDTSIRYLATGRKGLSRSDRQRIRPATAARVEAVLFVADGPLTANRLARHAMLPSAAEAKQQIAWLNRAYEAAGTPFRIERVAAGYRLLTQPEVSPWLDKVHKRADRLKLSAPALETLTIAAYRQPCTRADIEAVRGVQSTEMLKYLMERGLIRIAGEDDSLGRPYLYETTKQFLELFGLRSLADLPNSAELRTTRQQTAEAEADAESEMPESEPAAE